MVAGIGLSLAWVPFITQLILNLLLTNPLPPLPPTLFILFRSLYSDVTRTNGVQANSFFNKFADKAARMVPNLLWKEGSQKAYARCDRIWVKFLDKSSIMHVKGSVIQNLQEGWHLSRILQGYLAWLHTPGSKGPNAAYSVTTYRQKIAAAVGLQRAGGHHLIRASLSLVHRAVRGYEAMHSPKEKVWLTDAQYKALVALAWQDACDKASCDVWTLLWVLMATVEPVYRLTNILPETSREAYRCHFNLSQVRFRNWYGETRLRMSIPEKCSRITRRTVSLKAVITDHRAWTRDHGSLFEVHRVLMNLRGLDPSKAMGRLLFKGKILTAPRYRTWLARLAIRAKARPLGPMGLPVQVNPALIRRTAIAKIYRECGPTRTRVMVGHRGSKTAENFYLGFSDEEVSNFSSGCPHNFFYEETLCANTKRKGSSPKAFKETQAGVTADGFAPPIKPITHWEIFTSPTCARIWISRRRSPSHAKEGVPSHHNREPTRKLDLPLIFLERLAQPYAMSLLIECDIHPDRGGDSTA